MSIGVWLLAVVVAVLGLLAVVLWLAAVRSGRARHASRQARDALAELDRATAARQRLRDDPAFARRVRARFTRSELLSDLPAGDDQRRR